MKNRTAQEKRFGVQIDSLSDLICFGVLPAMIIYTKSGAGKISFFLAGVYALCALIRLAWFNVDEKERQDQEGGSRQIYMGLPVTTSALIIPILMGIGGHLNWPMEKIGPWFLLVIAAAFLTPFHLKKPALFGKIIMLVVGAVGMGLLLAGLLQDAELAKNYHGGDCLIFRLCATDYHHYSYIDDGFQGKNHFISGVLDRHPSKSKVSDGAARGCRRVGRADLYCDTDDKATCACRCFQRDRLGGDLLCTGGMRTPAGSVWNMDRLADREDAGSRNRIKITHSLYKKLPLQLCT